MKGFLKWALIIVVATPFASVLMIALVETRPSHEWAGIAQFLLCVAVPIDVALIVALSAYMVYIQRRINKLKGAINEHR